MLGKDELAQTPSGKGPRNWTLAQRLSAMSALVIAVVAVLSVIELLSLASMDTATNRAIALLEPAQVQAQVLINDLNTEETSVQTYLLSGSSGVLFPYNEAPQTIGADAAKLQTLITNYPSLQADLAEVLRGNANWRANWANPSIELKRTSATPSQAVARQLLVRTSEFTTLRQHAIQLADDAGTLSDAARATLNAARTRLTIVSIIVLLALLAATGALFVGLRRLVATPLGNLEAAVRDVAGGDLRRQLPVGGPPEVRWLGESVEVMRDRIVSELEAVEAARAELAEQAEALRLANADLDRFADVASHDLQEPLRKVAGFSRLLIERYGDRLDDRGLEFASYAADGATHMRSLIEDLLSYFRITRSIARMRTVALSEVIAAALRELSGPLENSGARVSVGELGEVLGDPVLLTALFERLLANAVEYRSARPLEIRIDAVRRNGLVRISVADNGEGIQPEYAERVFGIFQRLHHDNEGGTGIGLALCRRIVEVHGGTIWVDTGRFDGATVHLELPLGQPSVEPVASPSADRFGTAHSEPTTSTGGITPESDVEAQPDASGISSSPVTPSA